MASKEALAASREPMPYFKHDSNAVHDDKCIRLILRRGYDGYGRWWVLCEYLASSTGHRVPFQSEEDAQVLARTLGFCGSGVSDDQIAIEDCKAFIADLVDLQLLKSDGNGNLQSDRLQENAIQLGQLRANGRKGGRPRKKATSEEVAGREVQNDVPQTS